VKKTLAARVAANALALARQGLPKPPFYLTGRVGDQPFSVHAEGERVILTGSGGARQEVELVRPVGAVSGSDIPLSLRQEAWERRTKCRSTSETSQRNPVGNQSHPGEPGQRPEASLAWCSGNGGCEA